MGVQCTLCIMLQMPVLCWPCTSVHIRSLTDTVLSCTLQSIHIFLCHIHTDQRSTVVSGSQQHITVTTSSPTLVPLSSAGHSLLDNYSSTSLHSQLRNVFWIQCRLIVYKQYHNMPYDMEVCDLHACLQHTCIQP